VYAGFETAFGARWPAKATERDDEAIRGNWIKAYPCCLQTHGAIEAAARVREEVGSPDGELEVVVHPVSLQTAWRTGVANGLEAKFSRRLSSEDYAAAPASAAGSLAVSGASSTGMPLRTALPDSASTSVSSARTFEFVPGWADATSMRTPSTSWPQPCGMLMTP